MIEIRNTKILHLKSIQRKQQISHGLTCNLRKRVQCHLYKNQFYDNRRKNCFSVVYDAVSNTEFNKLLRIFPLRNVCIIKPFRKNMSLHEKCLKLKVE